MSGPALTNRLADLAERAGDEARAWRRGSIEAHAAYLRAGVILAEVRAEARRGVWGAVLERAGIEARTARNMMALARAGFTGKTLHDAGGVKVALASLRTEIEPEKPETVSASPSPEPGPALAPTAKDLARERRAKRTADRRAAGTCADCGAPAAGKSRCSACRASINARNRRRVAQDRVLTPRLERAAKAGTGLRLSAADVARLADP